MSILCQCCTITEWITLRLSRENWKNVILRFEWCFGVFGSLFLAAIFKVDLSSDWRRLSSAQFWGDLLPPQEALVSLVIRPADRSYSRQRLMRRSKTRIWSSRTGHNHSVRNSCSFSQENLQHRNVFQFLALFLGNKRNKVVVAGWGKSMFNRKSN